MTSTPQHIKRDRDGRFARHLHAVPSDAVALSEPPRRMIDIADDLVSYATEDGGSTATVDPALARAEARRALAHVPRETFDAAWDKVMSAVADIQDTEDAHWHKWGRPGIRPGLEERLDDIGFRYGLDPTEYSTDAAYWEAMHEEAGLRLSTACRELGELGEGYRPGGTAS